ncbi:MAG TPA: hypothetical protein VFH68_06310, partial [Polyangia bacterium]|nr:hypothetical protein [Polyangia bacterium]
MQLLRAKEGVWAPSALGGRLRLPIAFLLLFSFPFFLFFLFILGLGAGCGFSGGSGGATGLTPDHHTWFPIGTGSAHEIGRLIGGDKPDQKLGCQSCHPSDSSSFSQITCVGCHGHEQSVTDRLHTTVSNYTFGDSAACYSCHPRDGKTPYDHGGVAGDCAMCHDVGKPFAALPKAGFTHPPTGGTDCGGCHDSRDWKGATPANSRDPAHDLSITAQLPTYAGTSIVSLTAQDQTLPMTMNHGAAEIPAAALSDCSNCHADSASKLYFPGDFHSSLANLAITQPVACGSCHADAMPAGFVGPAASNPARVPSSGEMKHDAVAWASGAPTRTRLVPTDCGACHRSPSAAAQSTWASSKTGGATAQYHAALTAAGLAQPVSCLDCHASSRPAQVLNSGNAALAAGVQLDHGAPDLQGDCAGCHVTGAATQWSSWRSARFHLAGGANPTTCLPCHAGERPTSTAAWTSASYKTSPFDYLTNAAGATHGDGQDCALCHGGPGTGAWGGTQNWVGGRFTHGAQTVARETCIACHSTQRPDLQPGTTAATMATALGFDHATNGAGECFGCHQATVSASTFVNYFNPATRALPGGDWKGGQGYPGSSFSSSSDQSIQSTGIVLQRTTPTGMVTGTTTVTETIYNGMLHISSVIPAQLAAGPTNAPDNSKCWHCHTSNNGVVTAYKNGQYHASLASYRATPSSPLAPFPQPTAQCTDCHSSMMPSGIVEKGGSTLWPMDHRTVFNTPITVAGKTASRVSDIDCSNCHKSPGNTWADGIFHANLPSTAVVSDCVSCHYPLMADTSKADTHSATTFAMKHASKQLTFQVCQTCHPSAVGDRALLPASVDLWNPGMFHGSVTTQPTGCLDCHTASQPMQFVPTQSSVAYALKAGATSTNTGQWMNHGAAVVAGKDCAACHAGDAKLSGSTWSRATALHAAAAGSVKTCQECHGLINGGGGVAGTRNNLPAGLTSSTVTTSAGAASGVAPGTPAQINHTDVNVSAHDCNFCHTQVGPATAAGARGSEWAQARFHASFNAQAPLLINTTTGRCSNCHLGEKPPASYPAQNHSAFTAAAGSTDCSACHSYPGTGSAAAPNWLGSVGGAPPTISVGGFTIASPPAGGTITQAGINNLPHPTVGSGTGCTDCHSSAAGGRKAIGYDHKSTLINANCGACHEAGSDLVSTAWNGATSAGAGAGDTRPYSIAGLVPSTGGNSRALGNGYNHFFAADCHECHRV